MHVTDSWCLLKLLYYPHFIKVLPSLFNRVHDTSYLVLTQTLIFFQSLHLKSTSTYYLLKLNKAFYSRQAEISLKHRTQALRCVRNVLKAILCINHYFRSFEFLTHYLSSNWKNKCLRDCLLVHSIFSSFSGIIWNLSPKRKARRDPRKRQPTLDW